MYKNIHDKPSLIQSLKKNEKGIKKKRTCCGEKETTEHILFHTNQALKTICFIRMYNKDTIFVFKIQLKT